MTEDRERSIHALIDNISSGVTIIFILLIMCFVATCNSCVELRHIHDQLKESKQ